jgi:hypothetical protein
MMVAPLSEGRHPGLHLREFGICAVCSMSTSTTQEGKGEPCIGKDTNSTATNRSTKALQIVKYLEGTFNGNRSLSMGKGCDLYGPSRTTTRTYEGNFVGSAMDRTENQKSPASPVRVKTAANWIRKMKPNADRKSQKITNIIADPHALITAYEHIKSKLRNMTPRGDDERKTFLGGGGEGKETLFFWASTEDGLSTLQNDCARENIHSNPQDKSTSQTQENPRRRDCLRRSASRTTK